MQSLLALMIFLIFSPQQARAEGAAVIPFDKAERTATRIQGHVLVKDNLFVGGLRGVWVEVRKGEKTLYKGQTNEDGDFTILGVLDRGNYTVRIQPGKYQGEVPVEVTGYRVKGVQLFVESVQ